MNNINLNFTSGSSIWMTVLVPIVFVVWIAVLIRLIKRTDLDGTTKICWVVVVCSLNLVGLVLYGIWGPGSQVASTPSRSSREDRLLKAGWLASIGLWFIFEAARRIQLQYPIELNQPPWGYIFPPFMMGAFIVAIFLFPITSILIAMRWWTQRRST